MAKAALSREKEKPITFVFPAGDSPNGSPDADAIARLAYSYWEARGYQGGSAEEDWLRAENALTARQTSTDDRRPPRAEPSREQALATRAGGRSQ